MRCCLWTAREWVTLSTRRGGQRCSPPSPTAGGRREGEGRKGRLPRGCRSSPLRLPEARWRRRARSRGERCRRGRQVRSAGRPSGARGDVGATPARGTRGGLCAVPRHLRRGGNARQPGHGAFTTLITALGRAPGPRGHPALPQSGSSAAVGAAGRAPQHPPSCQAPQAREILRETALHPSWP